MTPRETLSLDGTWTFKPDPDDGGLKEHWHQRHAFEREVSVPGPWQLYGEDMRGYAGYAWYHRSFRVPENWRGREVALQFGAVDYETRVWLNGYLLGTHEGGYTPFEFVLADHLREGDNHLVMRVYDPADNSEIPHGKQGSWYTRVSGPWQPVRLEARDAMHVRRIHVTPDCQAARIGAVVSVQAPDGTPVTLRVLDPDGQEVAAIEGVAKGGNAEHLAHVPGVRLWSPETPELYTAIARVGDDELAVPFGMRWVSYENGVIHLNGHPLYIRGALDQAFYPETIYRAPSEEAIENELRLAKAMGLNLLRKHIKLEDPRYLDACDRLGMLIWEEPACFAKYTPQSRERFQHEIEAMIARDYNHPSIIIWSLYNEEWGLEWRLGRDADKQMHLEELFRHTKKLDPTRLICDNSGWAHVKTDLNDYHRYFTAPDLIEEWKADLAHCVEKPESNFVEGHKANAAGVPVLISEFGVWGLPEVSRITDWYHGRPWWFDAQWAGHTEEFKYPATALRHFERYKLERVFGSLDGLGAACQRRMIRALKPIIEEMRKRPDLAGYVVTEFTDIEWESNGWLDYFRKPKAGFREFRWFNGDVIIGVNLPKHNFWENEAVEAALWASNHTSEHVVGMLRWEVPGFTWLRGELEVEIPPYFSGPLPLEPLRFTVPDNCGVARAALDLSLVSDSGARITNSEELTFTSRKALGATVPGTIAFLADARVLEAGFFEAGFHTTQQLAPQDLAITSTLNAEMRAHLARGGRVLLIAEEGERTPEKDLLSFRRLPRGESWDRAASILYAQPGIFGDLPVGGVLGWELEGAYPHHVVPMSNYLQDFGGRGIEMPSNQANVDPAGVLAGYFEGWLGKFGAVILRMPYLDGELTVTTLRLLEAYDTQPIATLLLHRLATLLMAPTPVAH